MLKVIGFTFKMIKFIFESALLILALLIYIMLNILVLTLVLFSILKMLLLGLLTLLGLLLVVVAAPHRCRPAHTAIVGELLVSLVHDLIINIVLDLSGHTVLDDLLDELGLLLNDPLTHDVLAIEGVELDFKVLVELPEVQLSGRPEDL